MAGKAFNVSDGIIKTPANTRRGRGFVAKDDQSPLTSFKKSRTRVKKHHAGRPRNDYTGLAGQTHNDLTAKGKVSFVKEKSGKWYAHIECVCKCGRTSKPRVGAFLNGHSKTCDHAARDRFMAHHDNEVAQLSPALVESMGVAYYPKDVQDYPDKHHRRYALAAMNKIAVPTFDYAMHAYRVMRGWIVETVTKVAVKVETVVKTTVKAVVKAVKASKAHIWKAYRDFITRTNKQSVMNALRFGTLMNAPLQFSFRDASKQWYSDLRREGRIEEQAHVKRVSKLVQEMWLYA